MKSVIFAIVAAVVFAAGDEKKEEKDTHSPAEEKCHGAETKGNKVCDDKFGSVTAKVTCKDSKVKTCMADEDKKQKECKEKVEAAEKKCMKECKEKVEAAE